MCVSLQVGRDRTQLARTPVLDVLPANLDWFKTAVLVKACRCVVAVDTGMAHLAGALGVTLHLGCMASHSSTGASQALATARGTEACGFIGRAMTGRQRSNASLLRWAIEDT